MRFAVPIALLTLGALSAQTPSDLEQRIQRIVNGLEPTVIVKGEPAKTTKLSDRMAALHVPGVSIAVIHDGKIEWARGFGVTRLDGPPVTPDTLFQAASISKPVAAMAALRLVQQGKLDLDTDVNQYLKSWKVPANSFTDKKKVTLRGLLTHTAGLTVHGFPGYAADALVPSTIQVLNGEPPANTPPIRADVEPGTIWRYAGGGYVVAQQLLQDATGEPFPKLMHDTVLGPIGMTKSTYEQPLPASRMGEVAIPYRPDGTPVPGGPHTYPEMAPAGLWTTPSDLARYAIKVQKSLTGTSNRVLSAAITRQMLTAGLGGWGLGPQVGATKRPSFEHGGANEGYRCNLFAYQNGDGLVVMTNGDNGGQLAAEIQRTVAHEYNWPDFQPAMREVTAVDPKALDGYPGAYQLTGNVMTISREGDQLFGQLGAQPKLPIFPEGDRRFFSKAVDVEITFATDAQGKATALTIHQNGNDRIGKRLDDAEAKRLADEAAARKARIAKHFEEQKPEPGSETALRAMIEGVREGKPDYSRMAPAFAEFTRNQLSDLQSSVKQYGAVQSIAFKGVGPGGADIYEVKFEHSSVEARISMTPEGKIESIGFRPL